MANQLFKGNFYRFSSKQLIGNPGKFLDKLSLNNMKYSELSRVLLEQINQKWLKEKDKGMLKAK